MGLIGWVILGLIAGAIAKAVHAGDEPGSDPAILDRHPIHGPVTEVSLVAMQDRAYPAFRVTILGVSFILDMAPDQSTLRDLRGAAMLHGEPLYVFPSAGAA